MQAKQLHWVCSFQWLKNGIITKLELCCLSSWQAEAGEQPQGLSEVLL